MSETTGGALVARVLQQEGVEHFFGIVDGTYTQLFAHLVELGIRMVSPRHESIAMHMAGAYARLSGKLGVAIASNGPGVANVLPGVAVENGEGNRVLLLTSSRRTGITYPDRGGAYQCFDHCAVIRPMAKWSESAQSYERIPELLRTALRAVLDGTTGRRASRRAREPDQRERPRAGAAAAARLPACRAARAERRRRRARRRDARTRAAPDPPRRQRGAARARVRGAGARRGAAARAGDDVVGRPRRALRAVAARLADGARRGQQQAPQRSGPRALRRLRRRRDRLVGQGAVLGAQLPSSAGSRWTSTSACSVATGRCRWRCWPTRSASWRGSPTRWTAARMPIAERREAVAALAEEKSADRSALDAVLAQPQGADGDRARRRRGARGLRRRRDRGLRRRQRRRLGQLLHRDPHARHGARHRALRSPRRGRRAGARRLHRAARQAGVLHPRRRRDGVPDAGDRDGRPQRSPRRSSWSAPIASGAW